jgi:hypothetical protein
LAISSRACSTLLLLAPSISMTSVSCPVMIAVSTSAACSLGAPLSALAKIAGHGGLADAPRAAEEIGVRDAVGLDRGLERAWRRAPGPRPRRKSCER